MECASICVYCDNEIGADNTKCSICLADVYKPKNGKENNRKVEKLSSKEATNSVIILEGCSERKGPETKGIEGKPFTNNEVGCGDNDKEFINAENKLITSNNKDYEASKECPKDEWICTSCTFLNKLQSKCCEVCLFFPQADIFQEGTSDNIHKGVALIGCVTTWTCNHCKCENEFDRFKCSTCQNLAPFFNKWICDKCSFFNELSSLACDICGCMNGDLQPCLTCRKNISVKIVSKECVECRNVRIKNKENCGSSGTYYNNSKASHDVFLGEFGGDDFEHILTSKCIICNNGMLKQGEHLCGSCDSQIWYCLNGHCATINALATPYCYRCKLKRNSNPTAYNKVDVYNDKTFVKMAQCQDCGAFKSGICEKCDHFGLTKISTTVSETCDSAIAYFKNIIK